MFFASFSLSILFSLSCSLFPPFVDSSFVSFICYVLLFFAFLFFILLLFSYFFRSLFIYLLSQGQVPPSRATPGFSCFATRRGSLGSSRFGGICRQERGSSPSSSTLRPACRAPSAAPRPCRQLRGGGGGSIEGDFWKKLARSAGQMQGWFTKVFWRTPPPSGLRVAKGRPV